MNDDFEEDYDEQDEPDLLEEAYDKYKEGKEKYDDIKEKIDKHKNKKNGNNTNDPSSHNQARDFDKSLKDKNMARSNGAGGAEKEAAKNVGKEAAKNTGKEAGKEIAKEAGKEIAKEAGKEAAKQVGTQVATTAATAGGTATATAGAVVGQAAIPVVGWIMLAVEALIAAAIAIRKWQKKQDAKNAENGVDSKGLRRLMKLSPLLFIFAIIFLVIFIIIVLMQSETYDKVDFMQKAVECFESADGCNDFMNTGWRIGNGLISANAEPLIRKTDLEIAEFVLNYKIVEVLYFGYTEGNSFLSMVEDIIAASTAGVLDEGTDYNAIQKIFESIKDVPIVGPLIEDVQEMWYYFRWLKMEKKVFNNTEWKKAYKATSIGGLTDIATWINYRFTGRPDILFGETKYAGTWDLGFHIADGTCSYLELPLDPNVSTKGPEMYALGVNEAIDLLSPYIPSWLEIYATYVGTGNIYFADDIYKYYVDPSNYHIDVTLYQLTTVTEEVRGNATTGTKYTVKVDDGPLQEITEEEYEEYKEQAKSGRGLFQWLKDVITDFATAIKNLVDELIHAIKEILGAYITVDSDYVGVVTKGYAFDYIINQDYDIGMEELKTVRKDPAKATDSTTTSYKGKETYTEKYCTDVAGKTLCIDIQKTREHTYTLKAISTVQYDIDVYSWQGILRYKSSSMEEYEEQTRYQHVFKKVVEEKGYSYTEDDIAMALDVIRAECSSKYGLVGGAKASDFVLAGDINQSVVNFAKQFNGKNLSYMMAVDDTNTFWASEWCAMFVSYCMKKADIKVKSFTSCSSFWQQNKDKPGFYDINSSAGALNGGYITSNISHIATYKEIQPGDIVLFRWTGAKKTTARSHTGIVSEVEKDGSGNVKSITVIEGNTGGGGYSRTKVSINKYTGSQMYNIVSFVSISKVQKEYNMGNRW